MAPGINTDIINILASKRLDRWRRDISEKCRKYKSKRLNIPVKPFHLKPVRKRMAKLKCSTSFLHIFSTFSSNFLQIFQMTKLNCFHHRSANVCKNAVKVKTAFDRMNSSCAKMRQSAARLLRQPILHLLWQCPWNISYDISCVCEDEFLSQWLVLCPVSRICASQSINCPKCHNKTGSFEWHPSILAKNNGFWRWDGNHLLMLHQGLKPFGRK